MMEKEALTHNIADDLAARNRNWDKIDEKFDIVDNTASEVVNARGDYTTLGERLDSQKEDYANYKGSNNLKIAALEKELNNYKSTMANVNINQEAKQTASGYGVVSLPKNAANGQVSVSVKGNTETDEEGNTKSTQGAMRLKSVGKNLFDKSKATIGKYVDGLSGNLIALDNAVASDYIKILGGDIYYKSHNTGYAFYDINKNFISGGTVGNVMTVPYNAVYLRATFTTDNYENGYIVKGSTATPYEPYTESNMYLPNVGELRSLPNGTKDEVRVSGGKTELIKRVSDSITINGSSGIDAFDYNNPDSYAVYISGWARDNNALLATKNSGIATSADGDYPIDDWIGGGARKISFEVYHIYIRVEKSKIDAMAGATILDRFKAYLNQYPVTLTYQLAEPIITPIQVSGTLLSNPSGTVYIEPVVADAGIYDDDISVLHQDLPIDYIEKLSKVDFNTGVETELDTSQCVIAEDKLSFTHPDLVANDIVFFTYFYDRESTLGETTIEYYDSRHTLKDTVTGKFYKVVPTVADGVLTNQLVEV